jgi:hypothetical protein
LVAPAFLDSIPRYCANLWLTATVILLMSNSRAGHISPALVAVVAWLIPGGGYFLLGERKRAFTVGTSIILLFLMGILIGGIRIMDPPGWGEYGYMDQLILRPGRSATEGFLTKVEPSSDEQANDPREGQHDEIVGSALLGQPFAEISDKPWYVCQILCGPATLAFSAASVELARPVKDSRPPEQQYPSSHSRSWEIGALYTAVAGMLNLLVIIDATYLASRGEEEPAREEAAAASGAAARVIPAKQPWREVAQAGGTRGEAVRGEVKRGEVTRGGTP